MKIIVFIFVILAALWYFVYLPMGFTRKRVEKLNSLMLTRKSEDILKFKAHFLDLGYSLGFIDLVLSCFHKSIPVNEFVPLIKDSFSEDYLWGEEYSDEHRTNQMKFVGLILKEYNLSSVTESSWREFEKVHGKIDNFSLVFEYLNFRLNLLS